MLKANYLFVVHQKLDLENKNTGQSNLLLSTATWSLLNMNLLNNFKKLIDLSLNGIFKTKETRYQIHNLA